MYVSPPEISACRFVGDGLRTIGYSPADTSTGKPGTWRASPKPHDVTPSCVRWLEELGPHLHAFNLAHERLYRESATGRAPEWVSKYLDAGKPDYLVTYSRMTGVSPAYPTVIRPDIIPTSAGMMITELDSVPGGMGITGRLVDLYDALGYNSVGEASIARSFAEMISAVARTHDPRLAIVVSEECAAYGSEMRWLANELAEWGVEARVVDPAKLVYSSTGLTIRDCSGDFRPNVVYRFFELFDIPNVRGARRLMDLNRRGLIRVVPPFRPLFEEKMALALFHHPALAKWWVAALGRTAVEFLSRCIPKTWILDPGLDQDNGIAVGPTVSGSEVSSWQDLEGLGRSRRRFVIKPSGFSEMAWGSRGVVIGHDISTGEWNIALRKALKKFSSEPHVLQVFHSGAQFDTSYIDAESGSLSSIRARARISPYYFVAGSKVQLSSVMATLCPLDKKKIHGMTDAVIVPCATVESAFSRHDS